MIEIHIKENFIMKRTLIFILLFAMIFSILSSCKGTTPDEIGSSDTYKITFSGTDMTQQSVKKGSSLNQPADPSKSNHIFGGWYTDENFTNKATFPLPVTEDTTLYAKFYDYQTAFQMAREKTIGSSIAGFEYDYTLTATAAYSVLSLSGKAEGNAKYSNNGNVSFYDSHTNSGILFYDGSEYQIRRGNSLQKISLNEKDLLRNYSVEEVDNSYRFDSSSFAKALFEYDETKLKSIQSTSVANEYKLNTSFNTSAGIAMASKILNNSMVKKLIENIPENDVDTGMYVTFSNGEVKTYRYEMKINITSVQFNLIYELAFKNVGKSSTISPRDFSGISLSETEIATSMAEVNQYLNTFISKEHSGYDFKVKTGVDFPSENSIDATLQGSALRKIDNGTIYFHNDIEIDSDLKNDNLYKSAGISDVHVKRTRLSNGEVWLIEKRLWTDKTTQIDPYVANATDSRYLFDIFNQLENVTFVQKVIKGSMTTYSIGVSKSDIANVLTWLNAELNLDPLGSATAKAQVFGEFEVSSVLPDEAELIVEIKDGALYSVSFTSDGDFTTSFANSRDFTQVSSANYSFDYSITVNSNGDTFEPYETVNKAK